MKKGNSFLTKHLQDIDESYFFHMGQSFIFTDSCFTPQ